VTQNVDLKSSLGEALKAGETTTGQPTTEPQPATISADGVPSGTLRHRYSITQPTEAPTAVPPTPENQPSGGQRQSQSSVATSGPERPAETNHNLSQSRGLRSAAEQPERRDALHVLLVLRAARDTSGAAPANAAGKPATSPAAANPAK
jgi:hypothetical protein